MKQFFLSRLSATHTENDVAWPSFAWLRVYAFIFPVWLKWAKFLLHYDASHPDMNKLVCCATRTERACVVSASQGLDCVFAEQAAATRVARGWANMGCSAEFTSCP